MKAKQIFLTFLGIVLILLGIPLLVLPGPGLLLIGSGVAILASQFRRRRMNASQKRDESPGD
jgi:hypothetical protein